MTSRRKSPEGGGTDVEPTESRLHPRWSRNGQPSTAVVEAVADALGCDPFDLSPLQHHLDADALDALLTRRTGGDGGGLRVTFEYETFEVTVDSDHGIEISPVAGD